MNPPRPKPPSAPYPRQILVLSAVVALSSALPHLYQAATTPSDAVFTSFVQGHNDQNLYMMWCRQIEAGETLTHNYSTAEDVAPIFVGPFWLALGGLARIVPFSLELTYRAIAVALAFCYLLIIWRLLAEVLANQHTRLFAFLIVAAGSGFGFFCHVANQVTGLRMLHSSDRMPEMWAYHSFLLPHFSAALCMTALLSLVLVRAWRRPSPRLSVVASLTTAALIAIHPYNIALWAPLLALHFVLCPLTGACRWRDVSVNLWAIAGGLVPAAYYALQASTNPMLASWAEQNVLRSPNPHVYLVGLGIILPLAILGWMQIHHYRSRSPEQWLIALWPLVTAAMLYSYPFVDFERRLVEGVHIPFAILGGIGFTAVVVPWLQRVTGRTRRFAVHLSIALLLVCIFPTNLDMQLRYATDTSGQIPRETYELFRWIEWNTPPDARLFTDRGVGQYCARYSLRHVHYAHVNTTVNAALKAQMVAEFYDISTPVKHREQILRDAGCGWVLATAEQQLAVERMASLRRAAGGEHLSLYRFAETPPPPPLRLPDDLSLSAP